MEINATAILIIIMVLLLGGSIRLSTFLAGRATCKVLSRFRGQNAIRWEDAKKPEDLGLSLNPQIFSFGLRDYKPYALQSLIHAGIIQNTPDDRLFLAEDRLMQTRISCPIKP